VLAQATLYGLPMTRLQMPVTSVVSQGPTKFGTLSSPGLTDGLTTRQVRFEPIYQTHAVTETTITGTYFSVGNEVEVNEWQPIQPRTSLDISLSEQTPHGAFFEGGSYQSFENFDPVVTRIVTETTDLSIWQEEPEFNYPDIWQPSWWSLINQVWTPEGVEQRLVVIPAQYHSISADLGIERLFDVMTYTVYYSNSIDLVPPSIWSIDISVQGNSDQVVVEVTDLSDIVRVGVAYTLGDGVWDTVDLTRSVSNPNIWIGAIPHEETLEWFVQAVDKAGNVAINENKGAYYGPASIRVWLPLVTH
jgi:hypothetical protein